MSIIIEHKSPQASRRKKAERGRKLNAGMPWKAHVFQVSRDDYALITGRAATLTALLNRGAVQPADTEYSHPAGVVKLRWRSKANESVTFTVEEFLDFGIAVDAYIDGIYQESFGGS